MEDLIQCSLLVSTPRARLEEKRTPQKLCHKIFTAVRPINGSDPVTIATGWVLLSLFPPERWLGVMVTEKTIDRAPGWSQGALPMYTAHRGWVSI